MTFLARILFFLVVLQFSEQSYAQMAEYCQVKVVAQNRNRKVTGAVNVECTLGRLQHSAPFGNWGVSSPFGSRRDTDQFRGWEHLDGPSTKRQWNSCTTRRPQFRAPNPDYYNTRPANRAQHSDDPVSHGVFKYIPRISNGYVRCRRPSLVRAGVPLPERPGCSDLDNHRIRSDSSYMNLYELDWDGDDFVTKLRFPRAEATVDCVKEGCAEVQSPWVNQSSSSRPVTGVSAQFRIVVSAKHIAPCYWGDDDSD